MAILSTFEGVVLKKFSLLEMSQSVTVFTKEMGKVHLMLKGAKKITSRRAAHVQTGNLIGIQASLHVSGSWYVNSTSLRSGFSVLKESEHRIRVLYNMLLVLDRLLPLEQSEPFVYSQFIRALIHLNNLDSEHDTALFSFVEDLYEMLGYGQQTVSTYEDLQTILSNSANERVRLYI